jgi:hypothetical protein
LTAGVRAEKELLRFLLVYRRYIEAAAERIGADSFSDPVYRQVFAELVADPERSVDELAAVLDEDAVVVLQELLDQPVMSDHAEAVIDGSINAIVARGIDERLREIDRLLPLASSDEKDDLIREKRRLASEMQALGRSRWKIFDSNRT